MAMGLDRDARARAANNSAFVRLFYDRDGDMRTLRVLAIIFFSVAIIVGATVAVSFAGAIAGTEVLLAGALIVFLVIKLPFLGLVWWLMMRHGSPEHAAEWDDRERAEILQYLLDQAQQAKGRPDEAQRLQWLAREAWHVADTVSDEHRPQAVAVAVEIGAMRPTPDSSKPRSS